MTTIYTSRDFKEVQWKNGKGKTLELFRINRLHDEEGFYFRLSCATVSSSCQFSNFEGIDRVLYLLGGEGFTLTQANQPPNVLNKEFQSFQFRGEDTIYCDLKGVSLDFNIMIDRAWGKVKTEFLLIKAKSSLEVNQKEQCFLFIYQPTPILISIAAKEKYLFKTEAEAKLIKISIVQS